MLLKNVTGYQIYEYTVCNQAGSVEKLGLASDVLKMVPLDGQSMQNGPTGQEPDSLLIFFVLLFTGVLLIVTLILATVYLFTKLWEFLANWGLKLLASFTEAAKQALENAIKIIILVLACIAAAFTYFGLTLMAVSLILLLMSFCLIYNAQLQLIGFISFNIIKNNRKANFSIIIIWEYFSIIDLELPSLKISVESGEIKGEYITNILFAHEKYEWNYPENNIQSYNNTLIGKDINIDAVEIGFIFSFLSGSIILSLLSIYAPDNIKYYLILFFISLSLCIVFYIYGEKAISDNPTNYWIFFGLAIGAAIIGIASIVGGFITLFTKGIPHKKKLMKIIIIILIIISIIALIILGISFIWFKELYSLAQLIIEIIEDVWEIIGSVISLIQFIKIGRRVELPRWKQIGYTLIAIGVVYLIFSIIYYMEYYNRHNN